MSRGEGFFWVFFWHWRETKGLGFGYKKEKLGPGCRLHFPPLARVARWSGGESCVSVSEKWESQKGYKEVKRSNLVGIHFFPFILLLPFVACCISV